jgi:hypothetical protein
MSYICPTMRFVFNCALLLLTGIFTGSYALAQYTDVYDLKPFTGGLSLGINLAQVDGDQYFGYTKPGITTGAFVTANFTNRWSATMELLYAQKGSIGDAIIESPFLGTYVARCHISLNYVEVPITVKYKYKYFDIEAGLSYARLVKTSEWIVVQPSVPISETENRFNSNDINYLFGASRRVYKNLYANLRFQYSVLSIRPYDRIPPGYGYGTKGQFNNLFVARLMYEF